jgi:hypothetical protein
LYFRLLNTNKWYESEGEENSMGEGRAKFVCDIEHWSKEEEDLGGEVKWKPYSPFEFE